MNALIYSPSFVGHRQIYVFVLTDILQKSGYNVYVAGNFSEKLSSSFYIDKLKSDNRIIRVDTVEYESHGLKINLDEFIHLQQLYNIDQTVFAEADNHIKLFNSQLFSGSKKFLGKTSGIFLRPYHFYQKNEFINELRYIKRLNLTWRTDARFFHEVLNKLFKPLDTSFYLDEYFVSKHKKTVGLPDVFQEYAEKMLIQKTSDQEIWISRLEEFKSKNSSRFMLLYFGTSQQRRGYDLLLKTAVEHNACFVHCGLRSNMNDYNFKIDDLRNILEKENRLFETNEYLTDPHIIEYFFKSFSHIILPYNNFYGSSGVMLQALSYNIPVMVPDMGIIGYRVKKHNLGYTYRTDSFEQSFLSFIKTPPGKFSISIEKYMKFQSVEKLESILLDNFNS